MTVGCLNPCSKLTLACLQSIEMSLTPKLQPQSSPHLVTSIVQPNLTPMDYFQRTYRREFNTPEYLIHSVGLDHDDILSEAVYTDVFATRRAGGTPIGEQSYIQSNLQKLGSTPLRYVQSHFDRTPLANLHLPIPKQYTYVKVLDFLQNTAAGEQSLEDKSQENANLQHRRTVPFSQMKIQLQARQDQESQLQEHSQKKTRTKKNSSKGLKNLSIAVAEIVREYAQVTYKEVANNLIAKLMEEGKIVSKHNSQDIQNAKRRVYDALNVLIASDVLAKHGKLVSIATKKEVGSPIKEQSSIADKMRLEILQKRQVIDRKNQKLSDLHSKYVSAINLQKRNKSQNDPSPKLRFPLLFLNFSETAKYEVSKSTEATKLQFDQPFQVWGDIDVTVRLGFSRGHNQGTLSQDVVNYIAMLKKGVKRTDNTI